MAIENWTDKDYAQAALDMLPGSVEEIAVFLRVNKIKGVRGDSYRCPIAQWVMRWTDYSAAVTWQGVRYEEDVPKVPLPYPVQRFMDKYDDGEISV